MMSLLRSSRQVIMTRNSISMHFNTNSSNPLSTFMTDIINSINLIIYVTSVFVFRNVYSNIIKQRCGQSLSILTIFPFVADNRTDAVDLFSSETSCFDLSLHYLGNVIVSLTVC